jgi:hypothetical protein
MEQLSAAPMERRKGWHFAESEAGRTLYYDEVDGL